MISVVRSIFVWMTCVAATPAFASEQLFEPSKYAESESISISYDDWSYVLKATVFEAGRSDRSYAAPPEPGVGRRIIKGNTASTRFEGNRLYFPAFEGKNLEAVLRIRAELAAMPDAVPMAEWTKNQQLAYWLNLYNVTLISELAKRYPEQELRSLLYGKRGLLDRKLLKVAGVKLSLNDIHHHIILENWDDPLVIYGLFHGYVGCANIRPEAYTADKVWEQLKENAIDFINSNRGARMRDEVLEVSTLYEENAALFPSVEALKSHIAAYADPAFATRVQGASQIKASVKDYYIADLFQGVVNDTNPNEGNASAVVHGLRGRDATLVADMFVSKMRPLGSGNIPQVALEYLGKIREKKAAREGQVSVEEYVASEEEAKPDE
ncbi:DUF547 domain-containing protein [Kordiimonas aestuarii]|uniref:DUF547 domain-containing protein n=1 Tax=Kordiimonas aestuarii TaxID=1005925 RepID=UPI0021CE287B|nr:DUF547 domain-containing protein [Kordiimonas aestuarii]